MFIATTLVIFAQYFGSGASPIALDHIIFNWKTECEQAKVQILKELPASDMGYQRYKYTLICVEGTK